MLVFFGTLDQVPLGLRGAQIAYFESLVALWGYPEHWWGGTYLSWIHLPVPGGYLLGPLFLVNLACSHFVHFRPGWRRFGIVLIHLGLGLILVGQLVTDLRQEEAFLWLERGQPSNYLQSFRADELVVEDVTDPERIGTVTFPTASLRTGSEARHERLPFTLHVEALYPNARLSPRQPGDPRARVAVTAGVGAGDRFLVEPQPEVTDPEARNMTTAIVRLEGPGSTLGTWLLCNAFEDQMPPQTFPFEGRVYRLALRFRRTPLPYTLTLLDFVHERYPGTDIPKHFSSRVRLQNPATGEDREVQIYMNHPLRYAGRTFYQNSGPQSESASIFQVVKNPGWRLPYIASTLITVGMIWQFSQRLWRRRGPRAGEGAARP